MNGKSTAANGGNESVSGLTRLRRTLLGGRRNPFDPKVFQQISLIAFFAWVGMGADGISSANYGPEEAFRALGSYTFLAPLLGILIAATVFIISASYSQIIEQFPAGGGGYLVATKLLHANAGVISGAALIVDYVLTIAVSVVSGVDALASLSRHPWPVAVHLAAAIGIVGLLVFLNLRGLRESIIALLPVFVVFVCTHATLVIVGLVSHIGDVPLRATQAAYEAQFSLHREGMWVLMFLFLNAFSMGAGTFTGIEAVSNGMQVLREPRVHTGKRTMIYMAASLSFLAMMLLVNFFLFHSQPVQGRTLNSVLFNQITHGWLIGHIHIGNFFMWTALLSAALLLFVAAQTGFIDGPRVLANMAQDSWLPHRFSHLSERLVAQNGVVLMGTAAGILIFYSRANIGTLVTLYAINVFITFSLSQLGMLRLWLNRRKSHDLWARKFIINGIGFLICATLLALMVTVKFFKGGWLTLTVTLAVIVLCALIHRHYRIVHARTEQVDDILTTISMGESAVIQQPLDINAPTAVVLAEQYSGTGIHVLLNIQRLFGSRFQQYVFVTVGAIDSGRFKGIDELAALEKNVQEQARKYVTLARSYGLRAHARVGYSTDYLNEIERICVSIHREISNCVFFCARLLFWKDSWWSRLLHNDTALSLQRRLMFKGLQFVVLPIRLR